MAEIDYQVAILLQNKFEQEKRDSQLAKALQKQFEKESEPNHQNTQSNLSDSFLARSLQEQFRNEVELERPSQNLVYDTHSGRNSKQTSRSLTDPSWEVIDPTPDIHMLFIAFNEKFFWNQLGSVTVGWSKRMTTCAGICSYQGRGGMCTITLSEPLLKLRPRKDLVETLLHEMIHAYLFVTNNNRDRDGHGPEFHRHMKRINDEAGTNITVYHSFHDEVSLYQTHWWRCNGPCQKRKPFFGLVRRAMNRVPGPNDFWWAEHSRNCGGQFIKVREPEKPAKSSKSKQVKSKSVTETAKSPDIRKLFPVISQRKSSGGSISNIQTINSKNESKPEVNKVFSNSSNIHGFGNLNNEQTCDKTPQRDKVKNKTTSSAGKKLGSKNSVTGSKNSSSKDLANTKPSLFKKTGPATSSSEDDYSVVRNHWANKFSNTNTSSSNPSNKGTPVKRPILSEPLPVSASKVQKLSKPTAECPVCSEKVPEHQINNHLDDCLAQSGSQTKCKNCGFYVAEGELQEHRNGCYDKEMSKSDNIQNSDSSIEKTKKCDICKKVIAINCFDSHVSGCLHSMFDRIEEDLNQTSTGVAKKHSDSEQSGTESKNINSFASTSKTVDYIDLETGDTEISTEPKASVQCLACNRKILKSKLNDHLEDCMSLTQIFDDENEPEEGQNEAKQLYNCPSCMKCFSEADMNDHIDICLNINQS